MKKRTEEAFETRCAVCGRMFRTRSLNLFLCRVCYPLYGEKRIRRKRKRYGNRN